ncbi:MAG: tetratricopeptide repeat protein [Candidatus Neomarinimicrobiota bacterium]
MLKARKKITRKELKRDPLMETIYQARQLWIQYRAVISRFGGVAIVVLVLSMLVFRWRSSQDQKAASVVGVAFIEFGQGNYGTVIAELNGLVEEYSGLKSFGNGLFLLGRSELMVGDTTAAEIHFRRYLDDYGREPLVTSGVLAGLGVIVEARGEYLEAAEVFLKAGRLAPVMSMKNQYTVFAGRDFLLADQPEKALNVLKPLLEVDLDFRTMSEVQGLVASAEAKVLQI